MPPASSTMWYTGWTIVSVSPVICPVHRLAAFTERMPLGQHLFPLLTRDAVNTTLRRRAHVIGMADAHKVSSKAFRRGHGRDLHSADCPSARLMRYAGWRSGAVFSYVPKASVIARIIDKPSAAPSARDRDLFSDNSAEEDSSSTDSSASDES